MKTDQLIFVCYTTYPTTKGGSQVFNHYLMAELAKSHRVTCLCFDKGAGPGVHWLQLPKLKPHRFFAPLQVLLAVFYLKLRFWTCRHKIILTYNRSSIVRWFYFPALKRLLSVEYFIVIHDSDFSPWFPSAIFRLVFRSAASVFGVSDLVCKEYRARTGREILPLRPFIPFVKPDMGRAELRDRYRLPREAQVLLFVGSLKPLKQPLVLVHALEGILEEEFKALNLRVLIVGDGPLRSALEQSLLRSHLHRFVRLCGQIEREELPLYYALSDLYVIPSLREAFPISLMEAIVHRLGIIGADSPGINNIIKEGYNGVLFKQGDAAELREKLLLLARNRQSTDKIRSHLELGQEYEAGFQQMTRRFIHHLHSQ